MIRYSSRKISQAFYYAQYLIEEMQQDIEDAIVETARLYNCSFHLIANRVHSYYGKM